MNLKPAYNGPKRESFFFKSQPRKSNMFAGVVIQDPHDIESDVTPTKYSTIQQKEDTSLARI